MLLPTAMIACGLCLANLQPVYRYPNLNEPHWMWERGAAMDEGMSYKKEHFQPFYISEWSKIKRSNFKQGYVYLGLCLTS